MSQSLTYKNSGVNYDNLDAFKRAAQAAASETISNLKPFGFSEFPGTRGESAYVVQTPWGYLAHVEEGLGTKNIIADLYGDKQGNSYYANVAQCTVAMIVNDMITLGIPPATIAQHLAVASDDWFTDGLRAAQLITGWQAACNLARATWGGGETPALKGIVVPGTVLLSGSAVGFSEKIITPNVQSGDAIIFFESSGIHANGLTMARKIADSLPNGYATRLSDGTEYGEALLTPTHIYVGAVMDLIANDIPIHYMTNITGHGWRKLMRFPEPFAYIIEELPTQLPIFDFMQEHGPVTDKEAYGNFNMGAGYALMIPKEHIQAATDLVNHGSYGFKAYHAGYVSNLWGGKKVIIKPKDIVFEGSTLNVR